MKCERKGKKMGANGEESPRHKKESVISEITCQGRQVKIKKRERTRDEGGEQTKGFRLVAMVSLILTL